MKHTIDKNQGMKGTTMKQFILKAFIILAPLCLSAAQLSAMNLATTTTTTAPERPSQDQINIAMAAAKKGDIKGLQYFINRFPDFWRYRDTFDNATLTHKAAGHGQLDALRYLLGVDHEGISLEALNDDFLRPMDMAVLYNRPAVVAYLTTFQTQHGIPL